MGEQRLGQGTVYRSTVIYKLLIAQSGIPQSSMGGKNWLQRGLTAVVTERIYYEYLQ